MLYTVVALDCEVVKRRYVVEADSKEEAIAKQENGETISSTEVPGTREMRWSDPLEAELR